MFPENLSNLQRIADERNFDLEQVECFRRYVELIEIWNRRTNLVSARDERRLVSRHIRDSLVFLQAPVWSQACRVMDLGSGAGFPGIPLKIVEPTLRLILVESKRLKALFLRRVVHELNLGETRVLSERAEAIEPGMQVVDVVVARAVAPLIKLWLWSAPFRHQDTVLLTLKGEEWEDEAKALRQRAAVVVQSFPQMIDSVPRVLLVVRPADG
ncbi:16S rRNA (guanine(527)-N(7))-methyltransferase RsmG [candidate division KSB1 bacterium]|nr:16S rRNA (guanine(527)-N(7))-methyltransferase RsmG [candidate division KSB1 bacterium]